MEEASTYRPPVGELVAHDLMGQEPSDEDTCQESHDGQEYLSCDEVEPLEQRLSIERETVDST